MQQSISGADSFILMAIPLFMLAGELMNAGGLTPRLIRMVNAFVGHLRGGLGVATVIVCMIFAGTCGSAVAEAAAVGALLIPAMVKQGYPRDLSAAILGASAELGPIIPPSVPMIIAASLSKVSVGKLFMGGMIPGILIGLSFIVTTVILASREGIPILPKADFRERFRSLGNGIWAVIAPGIIIGGMLGGFFTPTEAGAIATLYGLLVGFFIYRELRLQSLPKICYKVLISTATVMYIVGLAKVYSFALTRERFPELVANFLFGLSGQPFMIMLVILAFVIVLGMFLSTTPALVLSIPLFVPFVDKMGFDPVWFYAFVTIALCMGTLTPPVALTLYLTSQMAEVSAEKTFVRMV
ncbi:MAG: TRAP transporter large permease, partial [Deltaproteobacteria bacterium]|nr:TRAP transporter large permease [Deltaproteobacteria bacterium]